MEQPKKPKFDPNKAYDVVDSKKPAFNPDMPFEPVKKKDNTTSTSTTPKSNSASVQTSGSSDLPKFRLPNENDFEQMQKQGIVAPTNQLPKVKTLKKIYDLDNKGNVILPTKKEVKENEDSIIATRNLVDKGFRKATELELANFKQSTNLTKQEIEEKNKEVDDEINKNGFWNTAKDYGIKALNVLSSSVARMTDEEGLDKELRISTDPLSNYKQEFIDLQKEKGIDTSKLKKEDIFYGAKNLMLKEKKDKLKEDKTSLYIDSLSDNEKDALNLTKLLKRDNLNDFDKVYLANTEISKQEIEDTNSKMENIIVKFNNKEQLSQEEIDFSKNYEDQSKKIVNEYNENYIKYQKNNTELADVSKEYDLLKRDYDLTRKTLATIGGRSAQIIYGLATISNDLLNPYEENRIAINDKLSEANSKVNNLLENNYQKNTDGWNGIEDAFTYVVDTIANQSANIALMTATGGSSQIIPLLSIGAYSAGNKINDLTQSNNEGKTFYTEDEIRKYAYVSGAGEMLETGTMGNLIRFNKFMKASLNSPKTRELFLQTTKESLGKSIKLINKGLISENAEEIGTMWIDIVAKEKFLGVKTSKKEIADLTERTMKDTSTMSILMSATPQIAHQVIKSITPKSYVENLDKNTKEIFRLNNELKKANLTETESTAIKKLLDKKVSENKKMLDDVLLLNKNMDDKQRKKAIELELSTSEIRNEAKTIKKSTEISKDVKLKLLSDLETEYKKQEELREKISSGSSTILDVVSEEEKNKLKSNALKVLLKENPNSNEANFTNVKIEEKAIEIYKSENKSNEKQTETTITEQIVETQPQAEEQAQVDEVVSESNNNQISNTTENVASQEVVEKIPNSNQIKKPLTDEAIQMLDVFSDGTFPDFVSDTVKKIAEDNEIEVTDKTTPQEIFDALRKKLNNAKTPTTNTPSDGNISTRINELGEVAVEQKPTAQVAPQESVQSANDVRPIEGKTKITQEPTLEDISNFLNENFKPNEANKGTKETSSKKDTDLRPKAKQSAESEQKEIEVAKKWSLSGRTPMNKRKFKGDMAKANAIEPSDVRSMVLSHFLRGAKVASSEISQQGELKAKNNGFYGIATSKGKTINAIAHDIWESQENQTLKLDTSTIKDMVEEVISMHNKVQDIADSILKDYGIESSKNQQEFEEDLEVYQEVLEEENPSEEDLIEANLLLAQMSDAEILELVSEQEKSYEDYLKDLEERQVIFDWGPFADIKGTIQNDGNIISEDGNVYDKQFITKLEYVNKKETETPKQEAKKQVKPDATLLKEVDKKIEDARQKVRVAKDALDRKAKSLDKEMVKDQENLFGERKSYAEAKLFDERVDAQAREKATETERNNIKIAQEELKKLIQTKKDIESGKVNSNQVDLEDVATEENKQSEYKFSNSPSLKNSQAVDSSILPITPKATENILKNEGNWDKAIIGDVKNLGNGWFEVGKTVKGESILYSPTTDKAVTIIDSENKGGRNAVYVNDFINNNPTISEKQQRKDKLNSEVDKIADKIKDLLPGIKDPDLNKQGFSQDQLIDLVATAVKNLISAGIEIDEAIRQVIVSIKERFNVDVDENLVKEKLGVEKPQDFESKAGKKSVLGRMASGNNSVIKQAISKYSLDYEIENQEQAKQNASDFVDEVGIENAYEAVKSGKIVGAEKAFVYAKIIDEVVNNINQYPESEVKGILDIQQKMLEDIQQEFDQESRNAGRFISALANIYNSSEGRYNLSKQIKDYKSKNGNEIPVEILEKFNKANEKIKELEEKIKELEAKKQQESDENAFNDIVEAFARRNKVRSNKPITNKDKAKSIADKLRSFKTTNKGTLNASTPISIAYDLALEAAALSIEAGGSIADAIKIGVANIRGQKLNQDDQLVAIQNLLEAFDAEENTKGLRIDEDGKIIIPNAVLREKVENGVQNIEELTNEIMADLQELYPDVDFNERQVRDAITQYGKVLSQTEDEIQQKISEIKSLGKLASGLEDALSGKRPKRTGKQRRQQIAEERIIFKRIKALMRDLPMDDADLAKAWKTASDAIKTRLSNEIEELDIQLANGEKRKGEKKVIEYDADMLDLKRIRDEKKEQLDALVGKPEMSEEEKIEKAEKLLQKSIDSLNDIINNATLEYRTKPTPVTSARIEELQKEKAEKLAEIEKMREDAGIAQLKYLEIANKNALKRLEALKQRIADKDFAPRKRKPTPTDAQLLATRAEIEKYKEIFDKEQYKLELQNRGIEQKALDVLKDILSIPKILSFTADLSFVGIQNVTQIYKMGANSLINLAKTGKLKGTFRDAMAKTFKAMASPDFEQKFMQAVKANPNYQLWKDSKLGIVESHYKESAKAEVFQHNALSTLFDILGNYVASKGYEKAGDIIKNYVNIISIFERGQTVFENQMRINRFQEGVDLLKAQGLNPIDDIQEYRKVAAAVNTLTGRANTGSKIASALREANGTIFSSFSNWAAGVNQLNPYWYYTLTPTARKMALTDVAHHIIGAGSMISMAALYALGQDDDDEDKVTIETDPTSSDFAVIKIGNLRIDPWAGKKTTVVAFARLINGGKINKYGDFKKYGIEYDDENWIDLPIEYAGNKIAPGPRFALDRFFGTKKVEYKGNSFRENKYGEDFKESKYLVPLIFDNFKEVNKEQPNLFGKVTMALSWTGLINTNVYGGFKEGLKDMPDDIIEQQYKVKIQKIKDNEAKLESNIEKLAKEYTDNKVDKIKLMEKVDEMVMGDPDMYNNQIESLIKKVNKEQVKGLITDAFYIGLKKEKNPEAQAIMYYSQFKDDSGMTKEQITERDNNLRLIEFDFDNQKFIDAYRELLKSKK